MLSSVLSSFYFSFSVWIRNSKIGLFTSIFRKIINSHIICIFPIFAIVTSLKSHLKYLELFYIFFTLVVTQELLKFYNATFPFATSWLWFLVGFTFINFSFRHVWLVHSQLYSLKTA